MTFKEAVEKLRAFPGNEYKVAEYAYRMHSTGDEATICRVYVAPHGSCEAPTWEGAFILLEDKVRAEKIAATKGLPYEGAPE